MPKLSQILPVEECNLMCTVDETDLSRHHVLPVERHRLSRQHLLQLGQRQERQGTSQQTEAQVTETVRGRC